MLSPRYYVDCKACRDSFPIKGKYETVYDVRSERGGIFPLKCPHCGKTTHYSYKEVEAVTLLHTFGSIVVVLSYVIVPILIAFLFIYIEDTFSLEDNDNGFLFFSVSAIVIMIIFALLMSRISSKVRFFNKSKEQAPASTLTKDVAEAMSDEELLDWTFSNDVVFYSHWTLIQEADLEHYKEYLELLPKIKEAYYTIGATKHAELARQMGTAVEANKDFIEKCYDEIYNGGEEMFRGSQLYKEFERRAAEADEQEPVEPLVTAYIRTYPDKFCKDE